MKTSTFVQKGYVHFPIWKGDRIYMEEFTKEQGLSSKLKHWQSTVDQMLDGIDNTDKIYLMVDQKFVKGGNTHRRGGLHVDGFWNPSLSCHGGGHSGGRWRASRGRHEGQHTGVSSLNELIVLASNIQACRGVLGNYEEVEWNGGDYSHLHPEDFENHLLEPNRVYVGDTGSFLHESLPVAHDCFRTVVRLNIKTH
jgi:hypothetical protein